MTLHVLLTMGAQTQSGAGTGLAQLVDPRREELEVGASLQSGVLADLLLVLAARRMHVQNRVVVICGEFGPGGRDPRPAPLPFHQNREPVRSQARKAERGRHDREFLDQIGQTARHGQNRLEGTRSKNLCHCGP